MADKEWVDVSIFDRLPPELMANIFSHLPDLSSLLSVIETCQHWYTAYLEYHRNILFTILRRYNMSSPSDTPAYQHFRKFLKSQHITAISPFKPSFYQLYLVIRRNVIPRKDAEAVFDFVWSVMKSHLRKRVAPFGEFLAYTLEKDGQPDKAHNLRLKIKLNQELRFGGAYSWLRLLRTRTHLRDDDSLEAPAAVDGGCDHQLGLEYRDPGPCTSN